MDQPSGRSQAEANKPCVLFLEQQNWRAGAERVLEEVLASLQPHSDALVAFPEDGPFAASLRRRGIETALFPLGRYHSGRKSLMDLSAYPLRSLYSAAWLAQLIHRRSIQLVYINSPRCLVAGVLAARLTGRPSLFHLHMTFTRRADSLVAAWAAPRVSKIVACSQTAASSLASLRPSLSNAVEVIYNSIRKPILNTPSASLSAEVSTRIASSTLPIVGLVGRITRQKGHHVLLRAAAELARFGKRLQIVFVGAPCENSPEDFAYAEELCALTESLGLRGSVHWAGWVDDPNPLYALMDVLVIPSVVSEGLPLVALEALQWGVPVIGSRVGGIPEVVNEEVNGFLIPPGDFRALAQRLGRLLDSSELRAELQAGARASVDNRFSAETFGRAIRRAVFDLIPLPEVIEAQSGAAAQPCH
jgi:glycosyltransferase involved in cell wall biosynthesis